jgi:hypothetical protein
MLSPAVQFPTQKKSTSSKGKQFCVDCFTAALNTAYNFSNNTRQSKAEMQELIDLYHNKLNPKEVKKIVDPWDFGLANLLNNFKHYPIANSKIELLLGEEINRKFDLKWFAINPEAVSAKEASIREGFEKLILEHLQKENYDEAVLQKAIEEMDRYNKMTYQDAREMRANHFSNYLYKRQNLKVKFLDDFKNLLILGEEIGCVDIVSNEPIYRSCNPRTITTVRSGASSYIEDADIVIEDVYMPLGKVIDMFYEDLSSEDITYLEKRLSRGTNNDLINYNTDPRMTNPFIIDGVLQNENGSVSPMNIDISYYVNNQNVTAFDQYGNVRVVRVVWNSLRKLGELKWVDEDGTRQSKVVDENYPIDKASGEEVEWFWVNEWWETTRLAKDIYVKYGPRPVQFRDRENKSKCASGYIGTVVPVSLFKRMLPYSYLYDTFMYRTEVAFAKAKGVIGKLDISRMPDDWNFDQWLYYAEMFNWIVEDPFTEGKKGAATGKLSGGMNQSNAVLDMTLGNYIQQHFLMLQFIEGQLDKISGITPQREGSIANKETVGGVERSVMQSGLITEPWFMIHEDFKRRVSIALFETAKYAYRERKELLQYITDDFVSILFQFDGEELNEQEFGLIMANGAEFDKIKSLIEETAKFAMQNDKLNISTLVDIYMSESLGTMRRKLEASESKFEQRQQENFEMEQQMQQQQQQMLMQTEAAKMELEDKKLEIARENNIRDNETMIQIKVMELESKEAENSFDPVSLDKVKQGWAKLQKDYELNKQKMDADRKLKEEAHDHKIEMDNKEFKTELTFKQKELLEAKRVHDANIKETQKKTNASIRETTRHNKVMERKPTPKS